MGVFPLEKGEGGGNNNPQLQSLGQGRILIISRATARFKVKVDALLSCAAVNKIRSTTVLVLEESRRFYDKCPGFGGFK